MGISNGYRKIAAVLAFTITAGAFAWGSGDVYAAQEDFKAHLVSYAMTPGQSGSVPVRKTDFVETDRYNNTAINSQVVLSWSLADTNVTSYELQYPIETNKEVVLQVARGGTSANPVLNISYNLYQYNPADVASPRSLVTTPGAGFLVYKDAYDGYVSPYAYSSSFYRTGGVDNRVVYQVVTSSAIPDFTISRSTPANAGFSFIYDGHTIHFLWDTDNRLYVATDGVNTGLVYDFTLVSGTKQPTGEWVTSATALSPVYLIPTPTFEPSSHNPSSPKAMDAQIDLAVSKATDPDESLIPGAANQQLHVTFPTPYHWNAATHRFNLAVTNEMALTLQLKDYLQSTKKAFTVSHIQGNAPTVAAAESGTILDPVVTTAAGTFTVIIDQMEAGQIYSADIQMGTGSTGVTARPAYPPFGTAFTLLKYTIVTRSNRNYIQFWPYAKVAGEYTLGTNTERFDLNNGDIPKTYEAVKSHATGESSDPILMPISIEAGGTKYFRIVFIMDSNTNVKIPSQWLHATLEAGADEFESPTEFEVISSSLSRSELWFTGEEGEMEIKIRWDLGAVALTDRLLSNGALQITYSLGKSLTPADPETPFGELTVAITSGTALPSGTAVSFSGLDDATVDNIITKLNLTTNARHYYVEATIRTSAAALSFDPNREFVYPNVYFINIKPIAGDMNGAHVVMSGMSPTPYANFTLSSITPPEVPPPLYAKTSDAGLTSLTYQFTMPTTALQNYMRYYLPELPQDDAQLRMNFYISQNESSLNGTGYATGATVPFYSLPTIASGSGATKESVSVTADYVLTSDSVLYFSNVSGGSAMPVTGGGSYNDPRAALRDGKIVCVQDVIVNSDGAGPMVTGLSPLTLQSFVLDGLDKNQKYYIYSEIIVTHITSTGGIAEYSPINTAELIKNSKLSALAGITTLGDAVAPAPDEKIPITPALRVHLANNVQDVGANYATIEWDRVSPAAGEVIEYEVLRTFNSPMPDEMLQQRADFNIVWTSLSALSARAGLTSGSSEVLLWDGSNFGTMPTTDYAYTNTSAQRVCLYTDNTLMSNRIYYYYVRTVKTVNGVPEYSNWSRVTLTTKPVQSPTNLRVEPSKADPAYMNYDTQTQVMFSFNSTVTPNAQLGTDYNFYYQYKKEGEGWTDPQLMDVGMLQGWVQDVNGTWRYLYQIKGLAPGSSYSLRIFTRDADGSDSLYSNTVMFRTELDQKDYDEREELELWSRYFKDQLQKLVKDPYWLIADTGGRLEAVYRPTMFNSLIVGATDSNITLYTTDASEVAYYLPISSLFAATAANKGLRIVHGNTEIVIPPAAINANLNAMIADMNAKVKSGAIADYYLKITLSFRGIGTVDGASSATEELTIKFEALESSVTAERWDKSMLNLLAAEIIARAEDAGTIQDLKDRITSGKSSEDMITYIEGLITNIARDFTNTLNSEFKSVSKSTYTMPLDKAFTIIGRDTSELTVGNGYERTGGIWVQKDTVPYPGGKAMTTQKAGVYIFGSRPTSIPSLTGVPDAAILTSIIYKYNLEDFFGTISTATLGQPVNRDMLAGVVSRIAGAARGAEPIDWLNQNKKMTLMKRNSQAPLETQEALYLLLSLYEFKTNSKVASIRVTNYALTNNMKGLEEKYKPYVRAAFELGLYTNKNMQPTATLSVKDVLGILGNMDKRVKL